MSVGTIPVSSGCGPEVVGEDYAHDDGPWLTWDGDPTTTMTVSWLTAEPTRTVISYGRDPDALSTVDQDPVATRVHHVRLEGLAPDTRYFYRIPVSFETEHADDLFSFRTAPAVARPLRIGVLGDIQPVDAITLESSRLMAERMLAADTDFVVQLGDIAQDGDLLDTWHGALYQLSRVAAHKPLLPAIGNHDIRGDGGANWQDIFPLPYVDAERARYFRMDVLEVALIFLDNADDTVDLAQLEWLERELADARALGRWVFVFMHIPPMSTGTQNMNYPLQEALAPVFARHAVDGVFAGHDHLYEHYTYTYADDGLVYDPAHRDQAFARVDYWVSGGGGARLENEYDLTSREGGEWQRVIYDLGTEEWYTETFPWRPWNPERFVADAAPEFSPTSPSYFHDCDIECYQDDAPMLGHDYGENSLHYLLIEIDGNTCTVSARYPDGTLLSGPAGMKPQIFTFTRP